MVIVYVESGLAVIKHMQTICYIFVFLLSIFFAFTVYVALFMDLHSGKGSSWFIALNK